MSSSEELGEVVRRLRRFADMDVEGVWPDETMRRAADRIERLEGALRSVLEQYGDYFDDTMRRIYRDALEGK